MRQPLLQAINKHLPHREAPGWPIDVKLPKQIGGQTTLVTLGTRVGTGTRIANLARIPVCGLGHVNRRV